MQLLKALLTHFIVIEMSKELVPSLRFELAVVMVHQHTNLNLTLKFTSRTCFKKPSHAPCPCLDL